MEQRWQGLRSVNPLSARRGGATADPAKGRPARSPTLTVGGVAHAKAREEAQVCGRIGDTGTRPVRTDIDIDIEGLLYNTIDGLLRVLQSPRHHGVTLYCWVQGRGSAFHDRIP